jgi:hypothetical protein
MAWLGDVKNAVFWDVTPCRYCINWSFGGTYRLHLQGGRKKWEKFANEEPAWADDCRRWRPYVPPKRRFIQYLHGATSQNTAFFIVTAMKTTSLTWLCDVCRSPHITTISNCICSPDMCYLQMGLTLDLIRVWICQDKTHHPGSRLKWRALLNTRCSNENTAESELAVIGKAHWELINRADLTWHEVA